MNKKQCVEPSSEFPVDPPSKLLVLLDQNERETAEAAEKAAKAGMMSRLYVQVGQKMGIVELTKLEERFERNIDKLISYHNIIYSMVEDIERQVQYVPKVLAKKRVLTDVGQNPWELLGGWLHFLCKSHYQGTQAKMLERYSQACGKISQKEVLLQKRTRSHLIRKMRLYTGDESEELNDNVDSLKHLLHGLDETRHQLKSAKTCKEAKEKGEAYRKMIVAFNAKANEIQGMIDEVGMVVSIHQHELLKFAREVSVFHDMVYNSLNEVIFRMGYRVK
uniref:BAR domain-containing protein n=1 Tax=Caenorhabditis tropicalis TaxID=1561998 RepID=A0A1I7SXP9_9PELO